MSNTGILKRNNVYYFRIKTPTDVLSYIHRKEIWKSLQTSNLKLARTAAKSIGYHLEQLFTWIRSGMLTDEQIRHIIKEHLNRTLKGHEAIRNMGILSYVPKGTDLPVDRDQWQKSSIATIKNSIEEYSRQLYMNDFSEAKKHVPLLLELAKMEGEEDSPQYAKLCREFIKAEIAIRKVEIERLNGNYDNTFDGFLESMVTNAPQASTPVKEEDKGILLSKLIEEHIKEATQANSWRDKSLAENESIYKVFLELMGDRRIKTISHQDLIACRDKLVKLPANRGKDPKLRDKTIDEILVIKKCTPMSLSTVNKYLVRISTLFKWATKHQYIPSNYAEGMALPTKKRASEDREEYSASDIEMIKINLVLDPEKPERYWVPMIGMYSGMRLDEICQLYVADVVEIDKVLCFSVNEGDDKKIKTQSSKRIIPVHPRLIDHGFVKYLDSLKASGKTRLWENLSKGRDGYSHDLGKWYQRFNRNKITSNPKRVFHSFRHTLANSLKQKGVQEVVIAEILGHAVDSMTMSRYGKRYEPKVLLEALSKFDSKEEQVPATVQGIEVNLLKLSTSE